jgi:ABC-2 type transport system ATP-binding protein
MAAGITRPTEGSIEIFGEPPDDESVKAVSRIGYLDQDRPLYRSFRVADMLRLGERLNPSWDVAIARHHLSELRIPLEAKVGNLSVGQQAQVALTMCLAKRPPLLLLDEPVAALDPVAREELMHALMRSVAEDNRTVLLSTHLLPDVANVCDYVIVLSASRVQIADDLEFVLASHRLLVGSTEHPPKVPPGATVIASRKSERQTDLLVRVDQPLTDPGWRVLEPTLEEIVLAYLRGDAQRPPDGTEALPADVQ